MPNEHAIPISSRVLPAFVACKIFKLLDKSARQSTLYLARTRRKALRKLLAMQAFGRGPSPTLNDPLQRHAISTPQSLSGQATTPGSFRLVDPFLSCRNRKIEGPQTDRPFPENTNKARAMRLEIWALQICLAPLWFPL